MDRKITFILALIVVLSFTLYFAYDILLFVSVTEKKLSNDPVEVVLSASFNIKSNSSLLVLKPTDNPSNFINQTKYTQTTPEMRALAKKLEGSTNAKTIDNVYTWVMNTSNIRYARFDFTWFAKDVLKRKQANCIGEASLMMSLLRENGIPARMIIGPNHVWAEAWLNGTWVSLNDQGNRGSVYRWV